MTNLFKVEGQTLTPIEIYPAVSDTVNYLTFLFTFSFDWDGLTKSAIFTKGDDVFEVELTNDAIAADEHVNLSAGVWEISVVGDTVVDAVVTRQITTSSYNFNVTQSSATSGGVFPPSIASQVYVNVNQATPQTFVGGIPKLATTRVIDLDNEIADKKYVDDKVATVTADDFNHNDLANKQGGSAGEYYHTTQAQNAALHAHSNKTALDAVRGTNTGDQDVSGAISTHNTDAGAHAGLFGAVNAQLEQHKNRFVKMLHHVLTVGMESVCMLLQGDSTGDEATEWFYKLGAGLGALYPKYNVLYCDWNHTNSEYNLAQVIQTGTNGLGYMDTTGTNLTYLSTPDSNALDITGDIEIGIKLNFGALGATKYIASKIGASGNYSWYFSITDTNKLRFSTSANGTSLAFVDSTASIPFSTGVTKWVKVTLDADNGAGGSVIKFYTSDDGSAWTQLGDTVTSAFTRSIYASTARLEFLAGNDGNVANAKIYEGYVRNGIDGVIVACPNLSTCDNTNIGTSTFTDNVGLVWTINNTYKVGAPSILLLNASHAGASVTYSTDATRFAKQTAKKPNLAFINYGHNDGTLFLTYQATYEGLCTQLLTAWANVGIIGITQNPQVNPRTAGQINTHANLMSQIAKSAAKNNYGMVDVYGAMYASDLLTDYVSSVDGVHPTVLGSTFWANEVLDYLR